MIKIVPSNSPMKADKKIRCGNYIVFILRLGLRIAFGMDKNNSPHQRLCKKPMMAVQTNDVVPLPTIFIPKLKLRSLI